MNKKTSALLWCAMILLVSCGDDHLVKDEEGTLSQFVYAIPDGFSGNIPSYYDPVDTLYVEQGQTIRFYAGYSYSDAIYTDDALQDYYGEHIWSIGESNYNLTSFRHTFLTSGETKGQLKTVDTFGDTLQSDFIILVNTPNSIALDFPYNGYDQAEPLNETNLPLRWSIQGIDQWELAHCQVYISYDIDSLWNRRIGTVNCNTETSLGGTLIDEVSGLTPEQAATDSSFTLYWGVKLITKSQSGHEYRDSSEIFHFSTKILNEQSTIKIPIVHDAFKDNDLLFTQIDLIAANGDTLQKLVSDFRSGTVSAKIAAQSKVKVVVRETYRTEYSAESTVVDIPPHTVFTMDTIHLTDKVPPQLRPYQSTIDIGDSIEFLVYDDGSGISSSRLNVVVDGDSIDTQYRTPILSFYTKCSFKCKVHVGGEDYAHNALPNTYWIVENKLSHYSITGPYSYEVEP